MAMPSIRPTRFLTNDGEELVGICGVYVDVVSIAGTQNGKRQAGKDKLKKPYKWGTGKQTHSRYVESDIFKRKTSQSN